MNHPHLDQAREWAESIFDAVGNGFPVERSAQDTAQFVKSLPDEWIDAEKVRVLLDRWAANPFPTSDEVAVLNDVEALLAPKLPTLADMTPEDRGACRWMQATVIDGKEAERGVIQDVYADVVWVMFRNGFRNNYRLEDVTPLPDLPRLEWPAQEPRIPETPPAETVDTPRSTTPRNPRPEDVPAGEAWIVEWYGLKWVGVRNETNIGSSGTIWILVNMEDTRTRLGHDHEITLVSRLVPEVGA